MEDGEFCEVSFRLKLKAVLGRFTHRHILNREEALIDEIVLM